jgi:hypothetical protein
VQHPIANATEPTRLKSVGEHRFGALRCTLMELRLPVDTLCRMVPHVNYEISRMHLWSTTPVPIAALNFEPEIVEQVHGLINQALVETALLHMRVINEFLTHKRPTTLKYVQDIVADDYFDAGWKGRPQNLLSKELIHLDKRLAHVSIFRLEDETADLGFQWDQVFDRAPAIFESFRTFVEDLATVHPERGEWFSDDPSIQLLLRDPKSFLMRRTLD